MRKRIRVDRLSARSPSVPDRGPSPRPIELWRLRGAIEELRGLAIETSFGYAFGLELDTELVLLHLQRDLDSMVAYADRMEAALLAQGWQVIDEQHNGRSAHDCR